MTPRRTRAQDRIEEPNVSPDVSGARLPAEIEELRASLEDARTRAEEHLALAQRAAADYANLKRRTEADREATLLVASEVLLGKVLALADDFDLAVDAMPGDLRDVPWTDGIVAIDRKLRALLESEGVSPIEALGRPFDPREHEAVVHLPGTGRPEGEVVVEIRRGYRIRDRVLRPSLVAVSDGTAGPATRPAN